MARVPYIPKRFTLDFWCDDMGSFRQPGCSSLEDALWHVNSARAHDGLAPLDMDDMHAALRTTDTMHATIKAEG